MWAIEYEQGPITDARFYKFDHEPRIDGQWHQLFDGSPAQYRIQGTVFQFVSPDNAAAAQELVAVLELISWTTPLQRSDVVEVVITRRVDGFNVWDATEFLRPDGVTIPHLTRPALEAAIRRLRGV